MSKTIDEKVVEMRFDNKDFESNVKTSMSTLDKLKQALKFDGAAKGLEGLGDAARKVDIKPLGEAVETVKVKFSALEVMAVTALTNITNSAVNAGKQLVSSLTIDQVTAGWDKYAQKTGSVQTIMNATGESIDTVNGYLDKLMWFSDETSYGFTDMTAALGQLTSAGGKAEKLIPMIMGIANATAFAGKGTNEFSRSIYNLNQSYSAGHLQYMDWKSLELAGVASQQLKQTFIDVGVAMGKIADGEVTIANFSETLKDKWADTSVMETAFGKFSEMTEKAYEMVQAGEAETATEAYEILSKQYDGIAITAAKAAQEAKTFTEAIDATKDAVSSGWMKTFEIIFGNYEQAKELWTDLSYYLWDVFAAGGEARNELLSEALGGDSKWNEFYDKIKQAGVETDTFQEKVKALAKSHNVDLESMIEQEGSFEKALQAAFQNGDLDKSILSDALKDISMEMGEATKSTGQMAEKFSEYGKIVDKVIRGDFGNGQARVEALTKAGYEYSVIQDLVNKKVKGQEISLNDLSDAQLESIGYTEEQIKAFRELADEAERTGTPMNELIDSLTKPTGRELLIDSLWNVLDGLKLAIDTVKAAWSDIFPPMTAERLYNIIEAVNKFTKNLVMSEEAVEKFKRAFKGLFAVVDVVSSTISTVLGGALRVLSELFDGAGSSILDMSASLGDLLVGFRDWYKETNLVGKAVDKLVELLSSGIRYVKDWIKGFKEWLQESKTISTVVEKLSGALSTGIGIIKNWISLFKEWIGTKASLVDYASILNNFGTGFGKVAKGIIDWIGKMDPAIADWFKDLLEAKSVQDVLSKFGEAAQKAFESIKKAASTGIDAIKDWFDAFKQSPKVEAALKTLKAAFNNLSVSTKAFFIEGIKRVKEFIERTKEMDKLTLENLLKVLKDFKDNVLEYFLGIDLSFEGLHKAFDTFAEKFKMSFDEAVKVMESFKQSLGGIFASIKKLITDNIGLGEVLTVAFGAGLILMLKKAGAALSAFGKIVDRLTWAIPDISGVVTAIKGTISSFGTAATMEAKAKNTEAWGNAVLKAAQALAVLAGALVVLANVPSEDLIKAGTAMGAVAVGVLILMGALTGMLAVLGKVSAGGDPKQVINITFTLTGLAAAVFILVQALKGIESLDPNKINDDLTILGTLVAGLSLATVALSKWAPKMSSGSVFLIAYAAALWILVKALKSLEDVDVTGMNGKLFAMIGVMGLLTLLCKAIGGATSGWGALNILAVVISLKLLTGVFKQVLDIKVAGLEENVLAFIVIVGALGFLMVASAAAGMKAGAAGLGILGLSLALGIIIRAIKSVNDVSAEDVVKATAIVGEMIIFFSIFLVFTRFAGSQVAKVSITLIALAGAIAFLSLVLVILSHLDPTGLDRATDAVTKLIFFFGLLVAATGFSKQCEKTIIAMAYVIGVLAVAVGLLAMIGPEKVIPATVAMEALMGMFAIIVASTHFITNSIGPIIALGVVVVILAGAIYALQNIPWENALSSAGSLSLLLLSFAASLRILSGMEGLSNRAMVTLGVMVFVVAGLAYILYKIASLDVAPSIETAASLSLLLLSLSASLLILSGVGMAGPAAKAGITAFIELILLVGSLMAAIGSLMKYIPQVEEFLNNGVTALKLVGEGIGSFFGGIAEGFASSLFDALPGIGENLQKFATNARPFFHMVENLGPETVAGIQNLSEAVYTLTKADFLEGIKSFLGWGDNNLSTFASGLKAIGEGIAGFSEAAKNVTPETVTAASCAARTLADLEANLPGHGGKLQEWLGDNNLKDFGTQLPDFGRALTIYGRIIKNVDTEAVTGSANAAKTLAELENSIPAHGGKLQEWIGDKDLESFGKRLEPFAEGLVAYADKVENLKTEAVSGSATAAKALAELEAGLPAHGGILQDWIGDKDLQDFGSKLPDFGRALVIYGRIVSVLNTEAVEKSAAAATLLSDLENSLPAHGGALKEWFLGDRDLGTFGENLKSFGTSIAAYSDSVSGIDITAMETARLAVQELVALEKNLVQDGGFFNDTTTLKDFGANLSTFGYDLEIYHNHIAGINITKLIAANGEISKLIGLAREAAGVDMTSFGNFGAALAQLGQNGIDAFIQAFTDASPRVESAISTMFESVTAGISAQSETISTAFQTLVSNALASFTAQNESFFTAGSNIMLSFMNGVNVQRDPVTGSFITIITNCLNIITGQQGNFDTAGNKILLGFIAGVRYQQDNAQQLFITIINNCLQIINHQQDNYKTAGSNLLLKVIAGIKEQRDPLETLIKDIVTKCLKIITDKFNEFKTAGSNLILNLRSGVNSQVDNLKTDMTSMMNIALQAVNEYQDDFKGAGENVVAGFCRGINENTFRAEAEAAAMAEAALRAARNALDINSPSKEFEVVGEYAGEGFTMGMSSLEPEAYDIGTALAASSVEGTRDILTDDMRALGITQAIETYKDGVTMGLQVWEPQAYESGEALGEQMVEGTRDILTDDMRALGITQAIETYKDGVTMGLQVWEPQAYESGEAIGEQMVEGTRDILTDDMRAIGITQAIETYKDGVTMGLQVWEPQAYQAGEAIGEQIQNGTRDVLTDEMRAEGITQALETYVDGVTMGLFVWEPNAYEAGKELGTTVADGVSDGVSEGAESVDYSPLVRFGDDRDYAYKEGYDLAQMTTDGYIDGIYYGTSAEDFNPLKYWGEEGMNDAYRDGYLYGLSAKKGVSDGVAAGASSEEFTPLVYFGDERDEAYKEGYDLGMMTTDGYIDGVYYGTSSEDFNPLKFWGEDSMNEAYKDGYLYALSVRKGASDAKDETYGTGTGLGTSITEGASDAVDETTGNVTNSVNGMVDEALATLEASKPKYKQAGKEMVDAFCEGIDENTFKAEAQAKAMAEAALDSAKEALDVNSPSGEFQQVGEYTAEGLTVGMNKSTNTVYNSGYNLGSSAVEGVTDAANDGIPEIKDVTDLVNDTLADKGILQGDKVTVYKKGTNIGEEIAEGVTDALDEGKVVDAADKVVTTATSTLEKGTSKYKEAGRQMVEAFCEGIKENTDTAEKTMEDFSEALIKALDKFKEGSDETTDEEMQSYKVAGLQFSQGIREGLLSSVEANANAAVVLVTRMLEAIEGEYVNISDHGIMIAWHIQHGMENSYTVIIVSLQGLLAQMLEAIRAKHADFRVAGGYLVEGFCDGIDENTFMARAHAAAMAAAALAAAKAELDINSPSKEFYKVGMYSGLGFVNALSDYSSKSYKAGAMMAEEAKLGLANTIANLSQLVLDGIDTEPTIRPVLDLSNVEAGTRRLNAMFSREQALSVSMSRPGAEAVNGQNGVANAPSGNTYTFTQNNYSPKALSKVEIYRQTKNQFSAIKRMVEA